MDDNSRYKPHATLANQDASGGQTVKRHYDEIFIEELIRRRPTPVFFQNEFGVVTMRWQFMKYYEQELAAGMPIGPHVFGVRRRG